MPFVITVHAPRHEVGKSFLTANLSAILAAEGRQVGIIDTDPCSGLPAMFGLDPYLLERQWQVFLGNQIAGIVTDETPWLPVEKGAIALIEAIQHQPNPVSGFTLVQQLQTERREYALLTQFSHLLEQIPTDYCFIETSAGFNEAAFLALAFSDLLILALAPESQDYQDTAVFMDLAQQLQVPQMALVAHQVPTDIAPEDLQISLSEAYQIPVLAVLPEIEALPAAIYPQLFWQAYPHHPMTQGLGAIAQQLVTLCPR